MGTGFELHIRYHTGNGGTDNTGGGAVYQSENTYKNSRKQPDRSSKPQEYAEPLKIRKMPF